MYIQKLSVFLALISAGLADQSLFNVEALQKTRDSVNPNATMRVPELIIQAGYPAEIHFVTTKDGYILEMHRIPHGVKSGPSKNKPVVFVMHGLLCSSADWVIAGPDRGLAFLLADRGYDVWMGNARGNFYSRNHVKPTPSEDKFWDFSWHEIGIYDLPAMIDFALKTTGQSQLFYIGHSQGTTNFYVMCSQKPEYNAKIKAMYSLAPIAYMSHMTSPMMRIIAPFQDKVDQLFKYIGIHQFLPSNFLMALAGKLFCSKSSTTQYICKDVIFVICGFDEEELDKNLLPVIMGHTPAGSSTKQLIHYAQGINSGKFRLYDYGKFKNFFKYFRFSPPEYDLSKITAPVSLHYSSNDWMSSTVDVMQLASELKNLTGVYLVQDNKFNHLDYMWGLKVKSLVYDGIFALMEQVK